MGSAIRLLFWDNGAGGCALGLGAILEWHQPQVWSVSTMDKVPVEVVPGVYMFEVPFLPGLGQDDMTGTLCYLIKQQDGWLLVDTGYNHDHPYSAFRRHLDTLGVPIEDIRWVFVTHYHPDHSGLAGRIRSASGARVIMHMDDWSIMQYAVGAGEVWTLDGLVEWAKTLGVPANELGQFYDTASFGRTLFPSGLEPDVVLEGEENPVGDVGGGLRAILTPGHSPGHVCLYDEERKLLFSGDHVLVGITPHISPSHLTSYNQLGQYLDALRKVRDLEVDMVLPAHQRPFNYLARRVDEILDHHRVRLEEMITALTDRPMSPWELAPRVTWDVGSWDDMDATNRVLAVRETLAHVELLESRGRVSAIEDEGLNKFRLCSPGQ